VQLGDDPPSDDDDDDENIKEGGDDDDDDDDDDDGDHSRRSSLDMSMTSPLTSPVASGSRTSSSDKGKAKFFRARAGRGISAREQDKTAAVFADQAETAQRVLGLLETVARPAETPAPPPPPPPPTAPRVGITPRETFAEYLRSCALDIHPDEHDNFREEVS